MLQRQRQGARGAAPCSSTSASSSWRPHHTPCQPRTRLAAADRRLRGARAGVAAGASAGPAAPTAPAAAEAAGGGDGDSTASGTDRRGQRAPQQQEQGEQDATTASSSPAATAIPPRPWAAGVVPQQQAQQQAQQQPDSTMQLVQAMLQQADTSSGGSSSSSDPWDDDFVSGVLAAVAGATRGRSRRGQQRELLEAADQQQQQQQVPQEPADQSRLTAKWQQLTRTPRAADDGSSSSSGSQEYYEQQQEQQQGSEAAGLDTPVQPPRYPHADSLAGDVKVRSLLMLLQDDAGASDGAPPAAGAATARTGYPSSSSSSSSSGGWGYASGAGVHSCLQRAQWVVEDIHRVQYLAWQSSSSSSNDSNISIDEQQQQQQLAAAAGSVSQQQQQEFGAVLSDLHLQLHKLLLAHLTREAPTWQAVARVCEDYRPFLNPRLVTGALVALQRQHMQGRKPAAAERRVVRDLVWRLLELVWAWQAELGPRECLAVVWSLVRLQRSRYLQLRDSSQLRDALAAQYQRHLRTQRQQERQAHRQPRRTAAASAAQQEPQQQQQQQQQQELLPLYQHAALLLGFARLGLPAATRLQRGTCDLVAKVVYQQLQQERQQLRQAPTCPQQRAQAAAAASHAGLLLYALSELGMAPSSDLLKLAASFTRPLLHRLTPADVAMLAVAFGRFGFVPSASWRKQFLAATGNSAAATIAAAAAAVAGSDEQAGSNQQQWYEGSSRVQQDSASPLNPADITSLLTAAHSMNADASAAWIEAMLHAALCQLQRCSLQQCVVLLLALQRLQVQPQLQWLLALTQHAVGLTSGSRLPAAAGSSNSSSSSSSSSSSGVNGSSSSGADSSGGSESEVASEQQQQQAQAQPVSAARGAREPDAGDALQQAQQQQQQQRLGRRGQVLPLLKRPDRHLQQLEQQQQFEQEQQAHQAHQAAQLEQQQQQWLRRVDYPAKHRLCLFLWALGKAVAQLPPESHEAALQQLQPWVAAAARHVAADMGKLRPLDLVQLLHALAGLRCRPGPGFMAAFASACDAQQAWFTAAMLRQLRDSYGALGMAPPRSLLVLMLATINSD